MEFSDPPGQAKGTILVVDDEQLVLEIGQKMLQKLGYTVWGASGGKEALEIYEKNHEKIDLVILDMVMPEFSGAEAVEALKRINPDIKILLSSGYSLSDDARRIMEHGCSGFIQKPFGIKALSATLQRIWDQA